MTHWVTIVSLCLCLYSSVVQSQSGTLTPVEGKFTSPIDDPLIRMITEPECVAICVRQKAAQCAGISYESYRHECRIIPANQPADAIVHSLDPNWRSFIHIRGN